MLEVLNSIDKEIFLILNRQHNSFFDFVMVWVSNKWIWIPAYAILAVWLYKKFPSAFFYILIFIAAAIAASDQLSSSVLKTLVMRFRPCHEPSLEGQVHIVNNYCGGQFGFVSSHASNAFALFSFIYFLAGKSQLRVLRWLLFWAVLVSYSRIYLGVHYPGDVICGGILGFILGFLSWKLFSIVVKQHPST